jgi:hypothetical protein
MGLLSNHVLDKLLLDHIWLLILKISPWWDRVAVFFYLHFTNKVLIMQRFQVFLKPLDVAI